MPWPATGCRCSPSWSAWWCSSGRSVVPPETSRSGRSAAAERREQRDFRPKMRPESFRTMNPISSLSQGRPRLTGHEAIENLSREDRTFPPAARFTAAANAQPGIYEQAEADWLGFWREQAMQRVSWFKAPTTLVDHSNPPFFKLFADGELNLSYNCLDRHLETGGDKVA